MVHEFLPGWAAGRWRVAMTGGDEVFLNFDDRAFEIHATQSGGFGMARGRFERVVDCRLGQAFVWSVDLGATTWAPGTVVSIDAIDLDETFRHVVPMSRRSRTELLRDAERFAVIGALDGELHSSTELMAVLADRGIHHVFQTGGFGFANSWADAALERLHALDVSLFREDMRLWFLDGMGDDTTSIRRFFREQGGIRRVTERISYLPRGFRLQIRGVEVSILGGEDDPPKELQPVRAVEDIAPTLVPEDLTVLGPERTNILITTDLASGIPRTDADKSPERAAGQLVQRAIEQTRPALVIHGNTPAPFDRIATIDDGDDRAFNYRAIALDRVSAGADAICWVEVDLTAWRWDRALRVRRFDGAAVPRDEPGARTSR